MKKFLLLAFSSFLFTGCVELGLDDGGLSGRNPDGGTCDRTGSGAVCSSDSDCPSNEECEHGTCQLHGSVCGGSGDGGGSGSGSGSGDGGDQQGNQCVRDSDCTNGLECEDGYCVPHGS